MTLYRRQKSRPPQEKEIQKKQKWLSEEALQIAVKRKEAKSKGEKERYSDLAAAAAYPFECRVPKNSKER